VTQSNASPERPTSKPDSETVNVVDISAIAAAHPVNITVCKLDLNTFDASQLTLLEVLDMAEAAGVEPEALTTLLRLPKGSPRKMRLLFALAWVVARRANVALTFAEVCTWRLEMIGEIKENPMAAKRAALVVGAATLSGLSPSEASNLTVAEIGAYSARNRKRARGRRAS
jgi:hypothetical protein